MAHDWWDELRAQRGLPSDEDVPRYAGGVRTAWGWCVEALALVSAVVIANPHAALPQCSLILGREMEGLFVTVDLRDTVDLEYIATLAALGRWPAVTMLVAEIDDLGGSEAVAVIVALPDGECVSALSPFERDDEGGKHWRTSMPGFDGATSDTVDRLAALLVRCWSFAPPPYENDADVVRRDLVRACNERGLRVTDAMHNELRVDDDGVLRAATNGGAQWN